MALIIDARVAGGRPQKRVYPTTASLLSATSRVSESVARISDRPIPSRRALTWARA